MISRSGLPICIAIILCGIVGAWIDYGSPLGLSNHNKRLQALEKEVNELKEHIKNHGR